MSYLNKQVTVFRINNILLISEKVNNKFCIAKKKFMYEILEILLKEKGVKAFDVAKATVLRPSLFTDWKMGRYTPKAEKRRIVVNFDLPNNEIDTLSLSDSDMNLLGAPIPTNPNIFVNKDWFTIVFDIKEIG